MIWDKEKVNFHNFILNNNIIGFFEQPLKLKSGRLSSWYINWRNISSDVYLLDQLTDYILLFVDSLGLNPQCFYGVPEGATKLGIITQFKWARKQKNYNSGTYCLSMGRGKPKEHGDPKDKFFVGIPKGETVILEDVTTTGESLITTIKQLRKLNVNIIASIGLTNRNELRNDGKSVEEIIKEQNLQYYAMSNAVDLLPRIEMNSGKKKQLEEYFKKYGTKQLEFKTIKM
jgi:orotate phosphoribosyltransferase